MKLNLIKARKSLYLEIDSRLNEARRVRKAARENVKAAMVLLAAIRKVKGVDYDPYVYQGYGGRIGVSIRLPVKSFRDAALFRLLEIAIEVLGEENVESTDHPDINVREYSVASSAVRLEVDARLDVDGSPLCRRVKVGELNVVAPVYEFKCD
jgi:hypothetical protein